MSRLVIVGIAPSREGEEGQPLSAIRKGATGHRLAELAGLGWSDYMMQTDRVNLCPTQRSSTIRVSEGRPVAVMLAGSILRHRSVILLGPNVAECFGLRRERWDWLTWYPCPQSKTLGIAGFRAGAMALPFHWAVMPHPSGRNLWYNDEGNCARASRFLQDALAASTFLP